MKLQRFGRLSAAVLATMLATGAFAQDAAPKVPEPTPAAAAPAAAPAAGEGASVGPVLAKKAWTPNATFEPLGDDTEAVKINGDTKTIKDLKLLLNLRSLGLRSFAPDRDTGRLRGEDLRHVASHVGAFDLMADQARERKLVLDEKAMAQLQNLSGQFGNSILYKQIVTDKLTPPTEEDLKKYYEENKDKEFRIKEELQLRHIFASTYVPYEVKPGDTLESIAKAIGGDEAQAAKILSDATKKPRVEGLKEADKLAGKEEEDATNPPEKRAAAEKTESVKDAQGKDLPPRALVAGEKLLVPTVGEKAQAAEAKIKEAQAALAKGEKFEDVAKKYSESENPGSLMTVRPEDNEKGIMPELKAAFMAIWDGKSSEPLRTKHGFQIVYREKYIPAGHTEFDQVKAGIERNLKNDASRKLVEKFFEDLVADPAVVAVNQEKLAAKDAAAAPDDVIVTIGGTQVTRKDLNEKSGDALSKPENVTPDGFKKFLWQTNYTQALLLDGYRKNSKIDEKPEIVKAKKAIEDTLLAQTYLDKVLEEKGITVSDEEIKKAYEEKKATFKENEKLDIIVMTVNVDQTAPDKEKAADEAVLKLNETLKGIQSVEEFRQKAKEINPKELEQNGGEIGPVEAMSFPAADLSALRSVKAPGKTMPIRSLERATAYWLKAVIPEKTATLEEKRADLEKVLKQQKTTEAREELLETYRREAKVEVLAPDAPAATPTPEAPKGT